MNRLIKGREISLGLGLIVLLAGLAAYAPVFSYNYFWEDPFDIGQVAGHSYLSLFSVPNSNMYYRPLTLILMKALSGPGPAHPAWPFHAMNAGAHLLASLLLFGAASTWFGDRKLAFAAAILFSLYPPGFEATSRAISPHSILLALAIGALWLYSAGRQRERAALIAAALALASVAMFVHENGVLIPGLVVALELFLWQRRQVKRFSPLAFAFLIPAGAFVVLWLSIPKPAGPPDTGLRLQEALYLSQGISFPVARLISQTGGWGLGPDAQAAVALGVSLIALAALVPPSARPILALALAWWLCAASLAWIARPIEYLVVAPRVLYFPSFAAALAWAAAIAGAWRNRRARQLARPVLGGLLVAALVAQNSTTLLLEVDLYRQGSRLMDQIIAAGRSGGRQLYVNVPDRFEYRQPLYPLGYWGMLLAPVSQDLSDFVRFATGIDMQTRSLSDFELAAAMIDASPYRVNSRGGNAHASGLLYETAWWADGAYWTDYHPDGRMTLALAGDIDGPPSGGTARPIGRIGDVASILSATAVLRGPRVEITLRWSAQGVARPTDTIFVHVLDQSGRLVMQHDGDSLHWLIPPSAWRAGHTITDLRTITLDAPLAPGAYRVTVGMYNRDGGQRYAAYDADGAAVAGGQLDAARLTVP